MKERNTFEQASVKLDIPAEVVLARQLINLKNARFQSMILNY